MSSDPYFLIESNGVLLYKSEYITKNLNPNWKPFEVPNVFTTSAVTIHVFVIYLLFTDISRTLILMGAMTGLAALLSPLLNFK